jgi:hypothetical protein
MALSPTPKPRSGSWTRSANWWTTMFVVAALALGGPAVASSLDDTVREPASGDETPYALDGRSRVETRLGISNLSVSHDEWTDDLDVTVGDFSLAFVHWAHENLALELSVGATNVGVESRQTFHGDRVHSEGLYGVMAGARFYLPVKGPFRPHVDLAGGVLTEIEVDDSPWHTEVHGHRARSGLEFGGGVDFLLGRHFVVGVRAATLLREGYRGELAVGGLLGWAFGGR